MLPSGFQFRGTSNLYLSFFGYLQSASFEFESRCVASFLLGDLFSSLDLTFELDSKTLLAGNAYGTFIEMLNINEERKAVTRCYHSLLGFVNLLRPSAIRDSTPVGIHCMQRHIGVF